MFRINKNLIKIKNIETINLENTSLTLKSKKYIEHFKEKKIKVLIDLEKLIRPKNDDYKIILGGSTISGKTCYSIYCERGEFESSIGSNVSIEFFRANPSFNSDIDVSLCDMPRWNGGVDCLIHTFICRADGILLLFDVSSREDFDNLGYCMSMITNYLEVEDFPVLLIANKIDLERAVLKEEIEKFKNDNGLIGYFGISWLKGINVKESFDFLMDYIIKKEKQDSNIN